MTQDNFIQFLHDNDCELVQDNEFKFYRCKRRFLIHSEYEHVSIPIIDGESNVKMLIACQACFLLKIEPPQEFREYYKKKFLNE